MSFLGWFDDNSKKSAAEKIADAAARYREKEGKYPKLALVNQADACQVAGLEVRVVTYVRPHHFWVGVGELPLEQSA